MVEVAIALKGLLRQVLLRRRGGLVYFDEGLVAGL
jgi:hypothetical protein